MSASVAFNCDLCSKFSKCTIKPTNPLHLKTMDKKSGWCFSSKKSMDKLENVVYGRKRRGGKKIIKKLENKNE